MGHGLEDQALPRRMDPGGGLQDGRDQLAAHAEDDDILGIVDVQSRQAVGLDGSYVWGQPCLGDMPVGALHGALVDVGGDGTEGLAVFRGDGSEPSLLTEVDGEVGVVGADIGHEAAAADVGDGRHEAGGQFYGHGRSPFKHK